MCGKLASVVVLVMLLGCISREQKDTTATDLKPSYVFATNEHLQKQLPRISKTHIISLVIESNLDLSKEHLKIIGSFENLQNLTISACKTVEGDFQELSNLTNLKELHINTSKFTDTDLKHLATLHRLETMFIGSKQVNGSGFASLAGLQSIRQLYLSFPMEDDAMKYIGRFANLEFLYLMHTRVTDAGLMHLSENYWLTNIVPSEHMTAEGMRTFRKTLLEGRRKARAKGLDVPPDDELLIQVEDPEIRGGP